MSLVHKIISDNDGRAPLNSEDLDDLEFHGIYYMEHMNLLVKDRKQAELFYCDCLGFKLQPDHVNTNLTFHINLGQQQFHTVEEAAAIEAGDDFRSNKVFGNIGLVVPSLDQVCKNLAQHEFSYENLSLHPDDEPKNNPLFNNNSIYPSIRVTSPSGNSIYVYGLKEAKSLYAATNDIEKLTSQNHQRHNNPIGIRGFMPGIRFFEFYVKIGNAKGIGEFYKTFLDCVVDLRSFTISGKERWCAMVMAGPNIHLVFSETDEKRSDHNNEGVHIAIYVDKFKERYELFKRHNLIWTNRRFLSEDSCETDKETFANRQFRFKDIINPDSGEILYELEHETRSLRHRQFMKQVSF